uniref:Rubrerythrin diiron-binding domain-containing protein n=1 Tax=viral metagenome TaxID=1070528 RepID=A0A6M3MFJ8_9ZZZZ
MAKCADNLLALQNALKQELRGEAEGSSRYREIATKFTALGETDYSNIFTLLAQAEHMHKMVIEGLVDAIDLRCGQEVSSQKGK